MSSEYEGLEARGIRITIDIERTGLYAIPGEPDPLEPDSAGELTTQALELIKPLIPDHYVATAAVKALI